MKPLHELLRKYVEKSNYTIYSLSYASKVNRTTLQRALSGERPISPDNLNRILPFLKLTLSEKAELDKAFLISQIGEQTYQKHMYIKDLLEGIEVIEEEQNDESAVPFIPAPTLQEKTQIIKGTFNIIKSICQVASCCINTEAKPYLYTIAHFQNRFFTDLYEQLQISYYQNLEIKHITPFIKNAPGNDDGALFNLHVLSTLFPFALSNPANCTLYYCYESSLVTDIDTVPFSYFIVCNKQVFLIDADCETAIVLPECVVNHYLNFFNKILQSSMVLISSVNTESYLSATLECAAQAKFINTLESQPCVTAFLDMGIIKESINGQLPEEYQKLLSQMLITQSGTLKNMTDCHIIFTRKGYDNFVQNGIIEQIPSNLYHPLSIKNRILILNRMLQATLSNIFCLFMIKEESFHPKIEIMTYDNTHMLLDYHNAIASKVQTCMITEPNMVITFADFIQNLSSYSLVYTQDETAEMLRESIVKLKEALPAPEQAFLISKKQQ